MTIPNILNADDSDEVIEFQAGDLVEVIAPDYDEQESLINSVGFNDDMEDEIGNQYRVLNSFMHCDGYLCYNLEGSEWNWAHEWLRLVEPSTKPTVLTDKDFEDAFSFFVF